MRGTSRPSSSRKMQARSTSPSWARVRQASPSMWSIDWAWAADSISPRRTSACAVLRFSDRRVHASARATASAGASVRSRCGAAAAAGSTVSTPTTSPSRMSGWPWAERMPRPLTSASAARRPVACACTGWRSRMTRARKGEWLRATGACMRGSAGTRSSGVGDGRAERDHHLGRGLVHPDRDARGPGCCAQAAQQRFHRGLRVEGRRLRPGTDGPARRFSPLRASC